MNSKLRPWLVPSLIILGVVFLDQYLKFFIKTTYYLGEEHSVFGNWFLLSFTENEGAAFGIKLNVTYGKLMLTIFRILAVGVGLFYLYKIIKQLQSVGLIVCVSLIIAGAIGNIIDCVFYGVYFSDINDYQGSWFHGYVVDMLYFPLFDGHFPEWFPIWGGEHFEFFSAVFNIADVSISSGIITLLVFQTKFFPKKMEEEPESTSKESTDTPEHVEPESPSEA